MVLGRKWWTLCTVAILASFAMVAVWGSPSYARTAFVDLTEVVLVTYATIVMAKNAISSRGQTRLFWMMVAIGCFLWAISLGAWTFLEVGLHQDVPDPFFGDMVLFVHVVPFIAAVAVRPHRPAEEQNTYLGTLNFLILLVWWVFLYTFVVYPDQYVIADASVYGRKYDLLYLFESLIPVMALGLMTIRVRGDWKRVYWNLFIAVSLYTWSSQVADVAIFRGEYANGNWYEISFVASLCWFVFAGLQARELNLSTENLPARTGKWQAWSPRMAMAAILSLPILGAWAQLMDTSPAPIRRFRLIVTLVAMLVLSVFVFLRQYLLHRELISLLDESNRSLENLKRLQTQVVQKEKLASLGQLVAGAAHEINNPVAAILGYSELLATNTALSETQASMAQKIGQQARRTRDLVSGLLSFAQRTQSVKTPLDLGELLQRALQMKMLHLETAKIQVHTSIPSRMPSILGNSHQLLQSFLEIITNAMDAMEECGGGTLNIRIQVEDHDVIVEFADSGPGIAEPARVFDPFYTTKPIGKGTGLGLSAAYGVVQDHDGQITCSNPPGGGALFSLRFPQTSIQIGRNSHQELTRALVSG